MSKRGFISRYLLILKKLKLKPYVSFEELEDYIEDKMGYMQDNDDSLKIAFSKRTFQRDVREISNLFGIDIEYSKSEKGYFISSEEYANTNFQDMLESFDIFNALKLAQNIAPYIYFEKRKPKGIENMYGLLHAITNKLQIKFSYQKYWEDELSQRVVEPYALKEFKNRWYVLAKDTQDNCLKSFALDRLTRLFVTTQMFEYPENFNLEEKFKYSFGVMNADVSEAEDVILSFEPFQGKYIKSLPLHDTQEIIIDNETEFRIRLKIYLSFDFFMELMSFGASIKVLSPQSLADEIKEAHEHASQQYL